MLFQVIAFVAPGWIWFEKYTPSFWIGYVFITLSFIGQLVCAYHALRETNRQKFFYKVSLIRTSYTGLILSFVFGGGCMLLSPLPYWVGGILCTALLAGNVIAVVKATTTAELVSAVDERVKVQTSFIRNLTADAEALLTRAKSEEAKTACKKVYEAVRYSDPVSSGALADVEAEISEKMQVLAAAVADGKEEEIATVAEEVMVLIGDRNRKCKVLK